MDTENTIIIITGLSGTGKTTLAKKLYDDIADSTMISKDTINETMSDLLKKKEGDHFSAFIKHIFIEMADFCIQRNDRIIILESPFNTSWIDVFKELVNNKYKFITIHVKCHSFEEICKRINKRLDNKERHPTHFRKEYDPKLKDQYNGSFIEDMGEYKSFKEAFQNNTYTEICLGTTLEYYTDEDKYNKLLNELKAMI